ncbi:MAG: hypothetical protein AB1Z18_07250 [Desulfobacterales bacterium]
MLTPRSKWSYQEKRLLAELPELRFKWEIMTEYPKQYEAYYNDHFGFRQWLIQRYNRYMKRIFGGRYINPKVLSGDDGWMFFTVNGLMDSYLGQNRLTESELEILRSNLENKTEWLARKGIRYLFVVAPDKQSIYPEYLPQDIQKHSGKTRFDQLIEHMQQRSSVDVLDLRPLLLQAKIRQQVYYRTDAHWNVDGVVVAYHDIMERVREMFPEALLPVVSSVEQRRVYAPKGDLANIVQLEEHLAEKIMVPDVPERCAQPLQIELQGVSADHAFQCKNAELRVVMFVDSFALALEALFSESFRELLVVWRPYDHGLMIQLIDRFKPQLVIEEMAERYLDRVRPPEQSIVADPVGISSGSQ